MALALRTAAPLRPEIRLAQALSEFEAILSDDDKKSFRTWRAERPPAVSDVMKVTAEIDKNNGRRTSRRCFGPRLTSILGAVQQFSTVVDVIIGGTQSPIATSIWGVLRMTLQITVNFASYFDSLSALFMRIGRSCPRYEQYGVMYPKSPRLQEALCEYFCTVVLVCKKAVLFIMKSPLAQLSATILQPFQSEFGPLELNLSTMAESIREEASVAFKQEVALETREASNFRAWSSSKASTEIHEAKKFKAQKAKFHFLDTCSTYNHQTAWKRARKAGESSRIFDHAAYRQWIQSSASSVLWITGILGSGKTVSTASVLQEISISFPNALVCYFFCSHDDAESLKARTIVGSLARQLLSLLDPAAFGRIDASESGALDNDEIVSCLLNLLPQSEQNFVIIDGLDECIETELDQLFDSLGKLLKSHHRFYIFCSSCPDLHTRYRATLQPQYHLPLPVQNPEIAQYINGALEDRLKTGSLCLGDPTIILTIRQALTEGSHGMFLWVVFQLESICAELTDEGILQALQSLPKDLPETFDRVLRRWQRKGP
ncbi:NACHT domain-containing protein isoform 2 [Cladophialophora immunda]|nr:NACHT domain-containing protein isoform 2 [Cladophialophora immunda]